MTKSEALEFLELPETATDSEIKIRVEEKLAYFERLSEKAPSDFLRRLHARNAAKVSEIQMASRKWPSYIPPVQEAPPPVSLVAVEEEHAPEPAAVSVEEAIAENLPEAPTMAEPVLEPQAVLEPEVESVPEMKGMSAVQGMSEVQVVPEPEVRAILEPEAEPESEALAVEAETPVVEVKPEPEPEPVLEPEPAPEPVAWLIRHTENQSSKTFPVYAGKNFLGRKPMPGLTPFIEVEEDPYISKVHAVLSAEKAAIYIDDPSPEEGKPSKNGIFVNADENRLLKRTRLRNNDTIQVGVTKLMLRLNNNAIGKIVQEVEQTDYMHTVIIDIG